MGASDLHMTTNSPPHVRLDGKLIPLHLSAADGAGDQAARLLGPDRRAEAPLRGEPRARLLVRRQGPRPLPREHLHAARRASPASYRQIPYEILGFKELGLPPVVELLCDKPRGLILVCGPTGSGKSTTLAAMIDKINRERQLHIVTIEDPIEFLHATRSASSTSASCTPTRTRSRTRCKSALRQDPDVVLIGEMRDLETIEAALRIAETGHLTLRHAAHELAPTTSINRIIDVFPVAPADADPRRSSRSCSRASCASRCSSARAARAA